MQERGFADRVARAFGMSGDVRLTPMTGSTNRLWRLDAGACGYVAKEFSFYAQDRDESLRVAAEFEYSVWRSGAVLLPEPLRTRTGALICRLGGSRGRPVSVRVHRWLDGSPTCTGVVGDAEQAGRVLATIQQAGSSDVLPGPGSLHWWRREPGDVLSQLRRLGQLTSAQLAAGQSALAGAERIIAAGEQMAGAWTYTHCDFKPENSLLAGGRVAVLDWDECGHCHPRLEAIESALRWSAADDAEPAPEAFRAFLRGYESVAGDLGALRPADFGKRVAALIYWLLFTGGRALGQFDDTDSERGSAAAMAADTIGALDFTVASAERWATTYSDR